MKNFNTNTSNNDEWLTPPEIISSLGSFDLDPCSPINRPWDTAKNHYSLLDNGLLLPWFGRVWLNPPYGGELEAWLNRMAMHRNGISLIFARTETKAVHLFGFPVANSLFFFNGRIKFYDVNGNRHLNANAPSMLLAYTEYDSEMISISKLKGFHISLLPELFLIDIFHDERTWKVIIGEAMNTLDCSASLNEIYKLVIKMAPKKVQNNKHYKEKIRQTLQYHFINIEKGIWTN
jgi:hypothetical protein